MIASVMTYLVAVSAVIAIAAWLADEGLRRVGVPTRWLWLTALAAPVVLLATVVLMPERAASMFGGVPAVAIIEIPGFVVGNGVDTGGFSGSELLFAAWLVSTLPWLPS